MELRRLYILVHGFCHAELTRGNPDVQDKMREYLDRERLVADRWRKAIQGMEEDEALAIIPWPNDRMGPATSLERDAGEVLGDRCFVLDAPLPWEPAFWKWESIDKVEGIVQEVGSAFLGQRHAWNMEEIETSLHSRCLALQLKGMMDDRSYGLPDTVSMEGWGAAFEGCVMKYCGNLTRLLDLRRPIEVEYEMSVPDAGFLLRVDRWERLALDRNLRCFLFEAKGRLYGLLAHTVESVGHCPLLAEIPLDPGTTRVIDKSGARLWPEPCEDGLPRSELGYREPMQSLVEEFSGGLRIPVNGGLVYRRAKAPAYVLPERHIRWEEFKGIMAKARSGVRPPQFL